MPKAIIIIPTYNEAKALPVTLEEVFKVISHISSWQIEILIVDDTSPDKTYEIVKALQIHEPKLHLLVNPTKSGLGGAYLKGMAKAFLELNADAVFEFDADLSHDPTKIPSMLAKLDEGYDMVLGSRYIPGGGIPENWGWHRTFLSVMGNLTVKIILTNFSITDWTGGFRAITRKTYLAVVPFLKADKFSGYTFQMGFLQTAVKLGFKITEVPFYFKDRTLGKSKIGPEYIKNALLFLIKYRLKEIMEMRLFKFAIVGGTTAVFQLLTLAIFRSILAPWSNQSWFGFLTPFSIATFIAIEMAVVANFSLSNLWTFADRKLNLTEIPAKFLQFNLASAGSIIIQMLVAFLSEKIIGLRPLFVLPVINKVIDSGTIFAIGGILIGMFWNFFAYTKIVWRQKK